MILVGVNLIIPHQYYKIHFSTSLFSGYFYRQFLLYRIVFQSTIFMVTICTTSILLTLYHVYCPYLHYSFLHILLVLNRTTKCDCKNKHETEYDYQQPVRRTACD